MSSRKSKYSVKSRRSRGSREEHKHHKAAVGKGPSCAPELVGEAWPQGFGRAGGSVQHVAVKVKVWLKVPVHVLQKKENRNEQHRAEDPFQKHQFYYLLLKLCCDLYIFIFYGKLYDILWIHTKRNFKIHVHTSHFRDIKHCQPISFSPSCPHNS